MRVLQTLRDQRQGSLRAVFLKALVLVAVAGIVSSLSVGIDNREVFAAQPPAVVGKNVGSGTAAGPRIAALSSLVARSDATVVESSRDLANLRSQLARLQAAEAAARAHTDELGALEVQAQSRLIEARATLASLAAAAYRDTASAPVFVIFLRARTPLDIEYRQELVRQTARVRNRALRQAKSAEVIAANATRVARIERDRIRGELQTVSVQIPAVEKRGSAARITATNGRFWLARWSSIANGTATTIRGQPVLGSEEMSRWFIGTRGNRSRATVPMAELARYYVEEGSSENIRGDIAFAQSVLETGGFRFPDGGQVAPSDNNFAGMGACDSCASGRTYSSARIGVRAQMQLLRVYAQPGLRNSMLGNPAVDPRLDTHYLKGKVQTWSGLTGTWATARAYGDRIIEIFSEMLAWLTDRAGLG